MIKRGVVVEADKSIPSQVRCLNLSDGSPYETLHAYISSAVAPYFKSFVKEAGKDRWEKLHTEFIIVLSPLLQNILYLIFLFWYW